MKDTDFLYDMEFFRTRSKHQQWQKKVGLEFGFLFRVTSVIDFGCANGYFLEGFKEAGSKVKGFELGFKYSKEFTPTEVLPFIEFGDVTKPIDYEVGDCSFSIEVAEHILPEGSDQFVKNLCLHSTEYIIFSSAGVGQGGVGHINCQPFSFWSDKFFEYGFIHKEDETTIALEKLKEINNVPTWIKKNLTIFERT